MARRHQSDSELEKHLIEANGDAPVSLSALNEDKPEHIDSEETSSLSVVDPKVIQFTTNESGRTFSCFKRLCRSMLYDNDPYVKVDCIATDVSKQTDCVLGVRQYAKWTSAENNKLRFLIPKQYMMDTRLPIKFLVELWDYDSYSFDDLFGCAVVDVKQHIDAKVKTTAVKEVLIKYNTKLIGTLSMTLSYTETLSDTEQRQLLSAQNNEHEVKEEVMQKEVEYGKIECVIMTFSAMEPEQHNIFIFGKPLLIGLLFIAWILIIAFVFKLVENLSFVDAVYFTVVTLTTVGYGDIEAKTVPGKLLVILFCIISHLSTLALICSMSHWLMLKRYVDARKAIQIVEEEESLRKGLNDEWEMRLQSLNDDVTGSKAHCMVRTLSMKAAEETVHKTGHEAKRGFIPTALMVFTALSIIWMLAWCLFFVYFADQKMDWLNAIYFGVISSTTVGFGAFQSDDYTDRKVFIAVVLLFGVAVWANIAGLITVLVTEWLFNEEEDDETSDTETNVAELGSMSAQEWSTLFAKCRTENDPITRAQFMEIMLLKMELVDPSVLRQINFKFHTYGGHIGLPKGNARVHAIDAHPEKVPQTHLSVIGNVAHVAWQHKKKSGYKNKSGSSIRFHSL